MDFDKIDELNDKIRRYRWLKDIADKYKDIVAKIDREKEHFEITGFSYFNRGDSCFLLNPHRPISYKFILDGLNDALDGINKEIEELEIEIKRF